MKRKTDGVEIIGGFIQDRTNGGRNSVLVDARTPRAVSLVNQKPADKMEAEERLNTPSDEAIPSTAIRKWPKKSLTKGNKHKLATLGISPEVIEKADPRLQRSLKNADSYRKHRSREYMVSHGYVSAGASSLLATSALALAASRWLYEEFALTGNTDLLHLASKLSNDSRQNELAAWELAHREVVARRKASAANQGLPWLADETPARGRPSKKAVVSSELPDQNEAIPSEGDEEAKREEENE